MILRKITSGFVVQEFDADTGRCLSQEFVAGDQVQWEDRQGNAISDGDFGIDLEGLYFPLEMKQPEEADRADSSNPLFKLGRLLMTPGALEVLQASGQSPWSFLARHLRGDWGDMDAEDKRLNDQAVQDGSRILSAYAASSGTMLWIITEADRSATTLLLPDEY